MQELFLTFFIFRFFAYVENFSVNFPNILLVKTEQIEFLGVLKTEHFPIDFYSFL